MNRLTRLVPILIAVMAVIVPAGSTALAYTTDTLGGPTETDVAKTDNCSNYWTGVTLLAGSEGQATVNVDVGGTQVVEESGHLAYTTDGQAHTCNNVNTYTYAESPTIDTRVDSYPSGSGAHFQHNTEMGSNDSGDGTSSLSQAAQDLLSIIWAFWGDNISPFTSPSPDELIGLSSSCPWRTGVCITEHTNAYFEYDFTDGYPQSNADWYVYVSNNQCGDYLIGVDTWVQDYNEDSNFNVTEFASHDAWVPADFEFYSDSC